MKKDYSLYRFYKGEKQNPFDSEKQNTEHMFWFYESIFDTDFTKNESSDWYDFFLKHEMGTKFMDLLSEEDYTRPSDEKKKQVFELWLDYLFTFKLYPEYGGENTFRTKYYNTIAQ